jgi:ketosteroid isomerase-like protein
MPDTAQQLIALEHAWANAMQARDLAKLDEMVTDEFFVTIAVQGAPIRATQRAPWLNSMPNYEIVEMNLDDIQANVYDNVGVVNLIWTQRARVNGGERSGTFFITDIWRKTENGWRVAQRHSSRPEPANAARPI